MRRSQLISVVVTALLGVGGAVATAGTTIKGPPNPTAMEKFALAELDAAIKKGPAGPGAPLTIVVGRAETNPEVKKLLDSGFTKAEKRREGYALKYDKGRRLVLVAGGDERGAMYGAMELIHHYLAGILEGKAAGFDLHEAPAIDYRGIWGWGGQIYNYEKFFDQMARWKMNLCIPWFRKFPANAEAFRDYAASRGVYIAWGYTWGWPSINWKDDATVTRTSDTAIRTFKENYAPLEPWGIYFQSHTEYGSGAGWGAKWVGLVNRTSKAIFQTQPDVRIFAGMHGTFRDHDKHIKTLDPRVDMMYEDLGCASGYICGPPRRGAVELNKRLGTVRGEEEKYGYVFKGFTQTMSGGAPKLEDDAKLRARANTKWRAWAMNEANWRQHFPAWNGILKDLGESKAKRKAVTLLIEGGVWGYRPWWAGCLLGEAMYNPNRDPAEIMKMLDACPHTFSAIRNAPEPGADQVVKHAAVGKPVKLLTPFGKSIGRRGTASINGAAGLVDGALGLKGSQTDPWWHGVPKGSDFEAVIDLGAETTITGVSARFLQQATPTPSFFPVSVQYAVSSDGKDFKVVATVDAKDRPKGRVKSFTSNGLNAKARYLRVKAVNGPIPQWHHFRGKKAGWMFVDEIVVNPGQ